MKKYVCLINNYNYADYLPECLNSVFNQSISFDKVIVVDDGSIDGSKNIILKYQKIHNNLYAIFKENGGQLSTFNSSLDIIDDGSQVFLLDSDDIYPPNYLELCIKMVGNKFPDFTYSSTLQFTDNQKNNINNAQADIGNNMLFAKTSALTRSRRCWVGNPTSCISLSSELLKKILPYPYPEDFKTRADDAIIFASSLAGAQKLALFSIQIGYRTHQKNNFYGKKISEFQAKNHDTAVSRLLNYYCYTFQLDENPSVKEFFTELMLLNKTQRKFLRLPNYYKLWNRLIRKRYLNFFE